MTGSAAQAIFGLALLVSAVFMRECGAPSRFRRPLTMIARVLIFGIGTLMLIAALSRSAE